MPYPPLKNPNTPSGQVFKEFLDDFKKESGITDEELQNDLKDPEVFKTLMSDFLTGNLGAKRAPGGTKYSLASGKTGQVVAGEPEWVKGPGGVATINPEKSKLPGFVNNLVAAGTGLALGGPGGAALNVGLQSTLGKDQSSGTGEAVADNLIGGLTSKFGGPVLAKLPLINKLPAWMAKGALTGAAVGGTNAAVQNLPKNQSLRPYIKHGDEVQYDPKTGKPMTQEQSVPMNAAIGGLIGAGIGAIPEIAGRTAGMAKSRQVAQTALQDLAPNSPETYQVEDRLKKTLDPIINAAKYKDVPKVVAAVREQLNSDASSYPEQIKKILISGLLNRDKGVSGLQNPNSMREIFHALGEELTDKIFGKGTHVGIMDKLNSASRVSKGGDYTKYSIDTSGGGILKDAAAKFSDPALFKDASLGHKAEVINSLKAGLGGGLPSFLPGGAKPALNVGTGLASMAGNFALHGIPDALAAQLNKLPPSARKKALEEILSKIGAAEYDPLTTQVVGNRGNE